MTSDKRTDAELMERLAEFRFRLRRFLQFSEHAATAAGLQPQQHQLLLQIAGAPDGAVPTIAYAAERLGLRHNSVVELANRSEDEGLLERASDEADARRVLLRVTPRGSRVLHKLAAHHRSELEIMGPALIEALTAIASTSASSPDMTVQQNASRASTR